MIEAGEVEAFKAFIDEPANKIMKRRKRAEKEAKAAKKVKVDDDLVNAIQSRAKGNFDSMISSLEAKYANGRKGKGKARKNS
jgi:hypothetical protein